MNVNLHLKRAILVLPAILLMNCDRGSQNAAAPALDETIIREAAVSPIAVTDTNGVAVANAKILIGTKVGQPFPNNVVQTDASGRFAVPVAWKTPLALTIEANGFVRTTFLGLLPAARTLQIRRLPNLQTVEVSGVTSGYADLSKDGFIDAGMIVTPLTKSQILNFQPSYFISPTTDRLKLPLGKSADVPSNISIPKQKENYIIGVTFEKLKYRIPLASPFDYRVMALHVRFPLKATIDGMQDGQNMFDLINNFDLMSIGYRDVSAKAPALNQDIAINQIPLAESVTVNAPNYDPSLTMLSGVFAPMGPLYFPSDLKQVPSGGSYSMNYPTTVTNPGIVLSLLRKKAIEKGKTPNIDEYSSTLTATNSSSNVSFLPLISTPQVQASSVAVKAPQRPAGLEVRGMYLTRSRIEATLPNRPDLEKKTPQWDVFTDTWTEKVELPEMEPVTTRGLAAAPTVSQRWEVMFLADRKAAGNATVQTLGPNVLESVSHVSKNSVDF